MINRRSFHFYKQVALRGF